MSQNLQTKKVKKETKQQFRKKKPKNKKQQKIAARDKSIENIYDKKKKAVWEVQIPTQEASFESQVVVKANWNVRAMLEMQAALSSYFLTRGILNGQEFSFADCQTWYDGIAYMFQQFANDVAGEPALTSRLRIVHDLINAFAQKDIKKHTFTKVSFGWESITPTSTGTYPTGWNTWDFVIPGQDDNTYLAPASVYTSTPSSEAYSTFLARIKAISANRSHQLAVVQSEDPSVLKRDVSAFAKVYSYLGLNPSRAGGFYNDVENEVDITAPILAHNVEYPLNLQDLRVPMKLNVNEGGPAFNLAPLLPCYNSWFNKCPINVKFLDMFEVVNTLIYWYTEGVKQYLRVTPNSPVTDWAFAFSQQDFYIVVRQMLLATFKDQWMGQFVGPLSYDSGGATNFVPLQVLGNCYGSETFRTMVGPLLLAENLSMLQTVTVHQATRRSKINTTTYLPVWGYYNDIQPIWDLPPDGSIPVSLFATLAQTNINLVDCTTGGTTYINVNSAYYTMVLDQWNSKVNLLRTYLNITDMANMCPPQNAALLQQTRVYGYIDQNTQRLMREGALKRLDFPCTKLIRNLVGGERPKDCEKKRSTTPSLPAPTNVNQIVIDNMLSCYPLNKEFYNFLYYCVLPQVRLDPTSSNDALNQTMYSTITGEGLSQIQAPKSNAPAYLTRSSDAALMSVDGLGKGSSSRVTIIMKRLIDEGQGGFLAGILGGLVKSIVPGADGIVDTLASVVPF